MKDQWIAILIVSLIVALGVMLLWEVIKTERGQTHQDVVCYSEEGITLFYAEDVTVHRTKAGFSITWPGGRIRELISGSCEYAPHGTLEDIQSWRGQPSSGGSRWASREATCSVT